MNLKMIHFERGLLVERDGNSQTRRTFNYIPEQVMKRYQTAGCTIKVLHKTRMCRTLMVVFAIEMSRSQKENCNFNADALNELISRMNRAAIAEMVYRSMT